MSHPVAKLICMCTFALHGGGGGGGGTSKMSSCTVNCQVCTAWDVRHFWKQKGTTSLASKPSWAFSVCPSGWPRWPRPSLRDSALPSWVETDAVHEIPWSI